MDMRVNQAGEDMVTSGINNLCFRIINSRRDPCDGFVNNKNIAAENVIRSDDYSITD